MISPVRNTLLQRMAIQCSMLRVQAAQAAIQNIFSQLPTQVGLMGPLLAWWYNVFYVYTAATVLLAAHLRPFITTEISPQSIDLSWAHALEVLCRYEPCSSSAERCVAVLEILFDRVPQDFKRQSQGQEEREKREWIPQSTNTTNVDKPEGYLKSSIILDITPPCQFLNLLQGNDGRYSA